MNISWRNPLTQNGEVTEYVLKLNNEEVYRGKDLKTLLSDLLPHMSYQLVLVACTSGGCTASTTMSTVTEEAPPTGLPVPTLKVLFDFIFDFQDNLNPIEFSLFPMFAKPLSSFTFCYAIWSFV